MTAIYPALLPLPSRTDLLEAFLRKKLKDVPTPAAIVDIAAVKRNCDQMLKACNDLQLDFRPHVKTHKVNHYSPALYSAFLVLHQKLVWGRVWSV